MLEDLKDWETLYQIDKGGCVYSKKREKEVIGDVNNCGYRRVTLYNYLRGEKKRFFVHRLVAKQFIKDYHEEKEINHIDGNKLNNCVDNLECVSRKTNERHKRRTLGILYHPFIVLRDGNLREYEFKIDLAIELGVSKSLISLWMKGRSTSYRRYGISNITYK
jgi:hypothetical protein|nr:MAG TPA: homing endonuclease [Bacteriophage sp.]